MVRSKIRAAGAELEHAAELLRQAGQGGDDGEIRFLQARLDCARQLRRRATRIFNNPSMKMLGI